MMHRREALFLMAGGIAGSMLRTSAWASESAIPEKTRLGIDDFSYNIRSRAEQAGYTPKVTHDPLTFLKHCHSIGAGGLQCVIGRRDEAYVKELRAYVEDNDLFIEDSVWLGGKVDLDRFEAGVRSVKATGARAIRGFCGGRRYEQFDRREQFDEFAKRAWKTIESVAPIVEKHCIPLAIENHKDWLIPHMLERLKRIDSEYVGVCIDTSNSFALLEEPMDVVKAYAPWAHSVHLKDMAVCEYEDGFLLADVVFGEGMLDLPRIVDILRKARPGIKFSAEMSTRNPLKVPCLGEKYWATLGDVPGVNLARAMRYVRAHASDKETLPNIDNLSLDEQVKLEEHNIHKCLRYAAEHLNL
ncbi:sugar phosphate isomerase/epimerase family protein [Planctomycetota bacterium]